MKHFSHHDLHSHGERLFEQLQKDTRLWLLCFVMLGVLRGFMVLFFREHMADMSGMKDVAPAMYNGARFDIRIAAYCVIPSILMSLAGFSRIAEGVRSSVAAAFVFCTILIGVVDTFFFQEFHDQFNHWTFGIIDDDPLAILTTIWKTYPVVTFLMAFIPVVFLTPRALRLWLHKPLPFPSRLEHSRHPTAFRFFLLLLFFALLVCVARGSLGRRPMELISAVTRDDHLNRLVPNPYYALHNAFQERRKLSQGTGLYTLLPDGNVRAALQTLFPQAPASSNIDDYFRKVAPGKTGAKARHIFLIIMESQDGWPLTPGHSDLGLCPELCKLSREGIWIKAFLPAGPGTMSSFAPIVTGIPHVGVNTNYQPMARAPLPFSITRQFQSLGYKVNLFYGGFLSWQRIGDFCRDQGFDAIYGGPHMNVSIANEWGVHDEDLYRFILNTLDPEQPSLNLILTASNHLPYSVDLASKGFPGYGLSPALAAHAISERDLFRHFGHTWYADQAVGEFARKAGERFAPALFAITGDHWSRHFVTNHPSLYEHNSVPLILYGPEVLQGIEAPAKTAGSHMDIAPTLLELTAPAGVVYHSFGDNLLKPGGKEVALTFHAVMTPWDVLYPFSEGQVESLPFEDSAVQSDPVFMKKLHRAFHGVAWWRLMKSQTVP